MKLLATLLTLVCFYHSPLEGARILLSVPMVSGMFSHVTQMAEVGEALLYKGHDVSWLVPNTHDVPDKIINKPFKKIMYDVDIEEFTEASEMYAEMVKQEMEGSNSMGDVAKQLTPLLGRFHTKLLADKRMLGEVEEADFDLVIIDNFFLHRNFYFIPAKLGLPYISLVDIVDPWMARAPWLPSFVPHGLLAYSENMNFLQRLGNTVFNIVWTTVPGLYTIPIDDEVLKSYTDDIPDFTNVHDLVAQSELWLITVNEYMDYVRPMMANMINIGGHSTKPAKPLPADLEKFVSSAKDGVILISFGSGVDDFPQKMIDKFMLVFRQIPQKVIWRLKKTALKNIPDNVMTLDWLPQNDLLGHHNVKLFITHCGRNGQFEALYHAVPMITMPIQGEQGNNAQRAIHKGFAVGLDIKKFTAEELLAAITEVIENPKYYQNIAKASEMFRNQVQHPLDVATYWVEHVIKYGADHLKSHALEMPWYQYLMLDVIGTLVAALLVILYIFVKILKCLCRLCCRRKVKTE